MKKTMILILLVCLFASVLSACGSRGASEPAPPAAEEIPLSEPLPEQTPEQTPEAVETVEATTMRLVRTEGHVALSDESGETMAIRENMRLFSGSAIDTETESRAGVSLDETKAAAIGAESRAELYQDGKKLAMTLARGEMYFSVSEPLAEDESFEISTSTMTLGIRGTSGYVAAVSEEMSVIILTSGQADIAIITGETQHVQAGQKAIITVAAEGASCTISSVLPDAYPFLLLEELSADSVILREAGEQNEGDLEAYVLAMEQYRAIIARAADFDYEPDRFNALFGQEPTGRYQYALEYINGTDTIPTLLLRQETVNSHDYVLLFRYDPGTGSIIPSDGILGGDLEAAAAFSVNRADNGDGLVLYVNNSGNGRYYSLYRLTFSGQDMETVYEWDGEITEAMPAELTYHAVQWQDIADAGDLSRLLTSADAQAGIYQAALDSYLHARLEQQREWMAGSDIEWTPWEYHYAVRDINRDGIAELILYSVEDWGGDLGVEVFTTDGIRVYPLIGDLPNNYAITVSSEGLIGAASGNGGLSFSRYELPARSTAVVETDHFELTSDGYLWTRDGVEIGLLSSEEVYELTPDMPLEHYSTSTPVADVFEQIG